MVEYGGVVRQGSGANGGGSFDVSNDVMGAFSDLFERIAALPPEVLLLIGGVLVVGWFALYRRTA